MPELPEMQALAERLDVALRGTTLAGFRTLGFSGLKTAVPPPDDLVGRRVLGVGRRGKYCLIEFDGGYRVAVHLSQGGRVDLERPPKSTAPRGSVVRFVFEGGDTAAAADSPTGVLVREHGTQRKAGWWVLAPGDDGPLAGLGPEVDDLVTLTSLLEADHSGRRLYTWLRDQHVVAGLGRGHTDDALHRAGLSPFTAVGALDGESRRRLVDSIGSVLAEALEGERQRTGALSEAKLGDRFVVHGRAGAPCPRCSAVLQRVSFDSYEVTYCPECQTGGRLLADRRLSRLLR